MGRAVKGQELYEVEIRLQDGREFRTVLSYNQVRRLDTLERRAEAYGRRKDLNALNEYKQALWMLQ